MLIKNEGYHLLDVPTTNTEILVNVQGNMLQGNAYLAYFKDSEYLPLVNGSLTVGGTYVLAQKYSYPLYVVVSGSVDLNVSVSVRSNTSAFENTMSLLPNTDYAVYLDYQNVQVGQAIITPETVWTDNVGNPIYDLLPVNTAFDGVAYPKLALVYPSLVTPNLPTEAGSPFPYKIVADYTGGN